MINGSVFLVSRGAVIHAGVSSLSLFINNDKSGVIKA